ncbi:DUF6130 family protein [Pseudomonas putida]|uniref:DUF6130 family protein n=1 Tax=Pseudomonas putida TaxID=303 RepID=UPI00383B8C36
MISRRLAAMLLIAFMPVVSPAFATEHSHGSTSTGQPATASSQGEAMPKLTLLPLRADVLKDGYVYLPFRVDNMTLLPLYTEIHGAEATKLKPAIGHLHVMVDGNGWNWIHALNDPIYFGPLKPGKHQVTLELVDAAHTVLETQTVNLVVP